MYLQFLALNNFRIYKEAYFSFSKGINGIIGPNALGKTTILEAIYLALFGRSFRTLDLRELIHEDAEAFSIELGFTKNEIAQNIRIIQTRQDRKIIYNCTPLSSYGGLLGILQGVLMAPHDLEIIKGPPIVRRTFLDLQLAQVDPLYVHHLKRFTRALKQRNFLLKNRQTVAIEPFEWEMAASASYLIGERAKNIFKLNKLASPLYSALANEKERATFLYKTQAPVEEGLKGIEEFLKSQYIKLRSKELALGLTLLGPHKDNIQILINGKEAKTFASEGQKHTLLAVLKFAEWHLIKERSENSPFMMIDDLTLSLDEYRQGNICSCLENLGQAFFSSTMKPSAKITSEVNWILLKNFANGK